MQNLTLQYYLKTNISLFLLLILAFAFIEFDTLKSMIFITLSLIGLVVSILALLNRLATRTTLVITFLTYITLAYFARFIPLNYSLLILTQVIFIFSLIVMFFTQFNFLKKE